MVGYNRGMVAAARNKFNEKTFEDLRKIRDFFELFAVRADAGIRLALTPEGRLFVGNASDLRLFDKSGSPMLLHIFDLAGAGIIPPSSLPEDLAVWLYVGLIDIVGGEERVLSRAITKLIRAGFNYFPDYEMARVLFQTRNREGLERMVLRQMARLRPGAADPQRPTPGREPSTTTASARREPKPGGI